MGDSLRTQSVVLLTLFAALVVVGFLLTSFYRETARTTTFVLPPDVTDCDEDGDCGVMEQIGCCPCKAGGARWAINKDASETLRKFLKRTCRRSSSCMRVNTCRDDLLPACLDRLCVARVANG